MFFRPTEASGVDSGIFCDRNFGIPNPYEVYNEVLVEWKPEKFSKFRAKINYCIMTFSYFEEFKKVFLGNMEVWYMVHDIFRMNENSP
jgi:hypothetical protein